MTALLDGESKAYPSKTPWALSLKETPMTRNMLIEVIEKRITQLNEIMRANAGVSPLNGLPYPKASKAFQEWNLLRDTSTQLQGFHLP